MSIILLVAIALVSIFQAILSSGVNKGTTSPYWVFLLGLIVSANWALISKYSTSLLRDGLIWDVLVATAFGIVMVLKGHADDFGLKQWIGVALAFGTFIYWGVIK
jgi:hypothetical protein